MTDADNEETTSPLLTFIATRAFSSTWADNGLSDADQVSLECEIIADPKTGASIGGTRGLRKMRFAIPGKGKSGGMRVCYAYFPDHGAVLLLLAFAKNVRANLGADDKKAANALIDAFAKALDAAEEARQNATERHPNATVKDT